MTDDQLTRFWSKVDKSGSCWLWTAAKDSAGYGWFSINGRTLKAHRVIMKHLNPQMTDEHVCHHCDVTSCVNPDHLYLGDAQSNASDREARNTTPKFWYKGKVKDRAHVSNGMQLNRTNLTPDLVRGIRKMREEGYKYREIAAHYGISEGCAAKIVKRVNWGWLE